MTRLRPLLLPGVTTLVMLAIMMGLGTWQVHRLAWKEGLLAQIDRAEHAPAVPLSGDAPPAFAKIAVTGRFRPDLEGLYGADVRPTPDGLQMGGQLIVPLERPGQDPVLVDRGWVPEQRRQPVPTPEGRTTVDGYARPADHAGLFSATDDTAARRFYTLDPARIGAALGYQHVAPFILVVLGPSPPDLYPDPARTLPRPPNNHLQYALTWFALGVTLLVIFVLYARKVLRS